MTDSRQTDLFGTAQPDLFGPAPKRDYRPDPAQVRAQLHVILGKARAAPTTPWRRKDIDFYQVVFPQMASWLPEEERAQLCFAFEEELKRLRAA